jgi:hypothetical protein
VDLLASTAGYLAAIIALAAGTYLAGRAARSPRTAIRRYLAAALIAVGVATAVTTPETLALTQGLDVLPNLVRFVGDLLAMGASFCVLAMLTHTPSPAATMPSADTSATKPSPWPPPVPQWPYCSWRRTLV